MMGVHTAPDPMPLRAPHSGALLGQTMAALPRLAQPRGEGHRSVSCHRPGTSSPRVREEGTR
jgi:hypothetical protein